jgi:hypothetical protein
MNPTPRQRWDTEATSLGRDASLLGQSYQSVLIQNR